MPKVSVIVASYNHEKYVGKSIQSVIDQTFTDWELLVVDDGSVDNSCEVINRYAQKDARIKTHFLEKNIGMCSVFNYAIEHANGRYIARIDSDDFWEPDKLKKQLEYMDVHPKCGVSFTWVKVVDENENEIPSYLCEGRDKHFNSDNRIQAQWLRTFFFEGCRVCHPTALIRKESLEKVGGKYNYIYSQVQDLDLWIRISKHFDIYVLPEKLINYRWFLSDTPNASASSPGTLTRGLWELFRVMSHFNDDISDELFCEAFREDMFNKLSETHMEIACERAFIMYHKSYLGNPGRIIGLKMLDTLFNNDEARKILIENYNFTAKTYAEWVGYPIFYDSVYIYPPKGLASNEITFKMLIKKWLSRWPLIFNFAKWCNQFIKKT